MGRIDLSNIKIPPLPTVAMKVMVFDTTDPKNGSNELEKIINPDKGVSSELLKISNSAFYGRSGSITNLKDAITLLGMKTIKNIIILQSTKSLTKKLHGITFKKHLQDLPILSALISLDLSNPLGQKKIREELFLGALLHKIGMTILAQNFSNEYSDIIQLSETGRKTLVDLEQEQFGVTHIEIGSTVFEVWKFPQMLKDIISHQYFFPEEIDEVSDYDRVIRQSDILARQMLDLHLSTEQEGMLHAIFEHYSADEALSEAFGTDYYDMIRDHPFFELVS
jgi:HD-like signal output (HDOD) protein